MVLIDTFVSVGVTSAFILPFRSTLKTDTRILWLEEHCQPAVRGVSNGRESLEQAGREIRLGSVTWLDCVLARNLHRYH